MVTLTVVRIELILGPLEDARMAATTPHLLDLPASYLAWLRPANRIKTISTTRRPYDQGAPLGLRPSPWCPTAPTRPLAPAWRQTGRASLTRIALNCGRMYLGTGDRRRGRTFAGSQEANPKGFP